MNQRRSGGKSSVEDSRKELGLASVLFVRVRSCYVLRASSIDAKHNAQQALRTRAQTQSFRSATRIHAGRANLRDRARSHATTASNGDGQSPRDGDNPARRPMSKKRGSRARPIAAGTPIQRGPMRDPAFAPTPAPTTTLQNAGAARPPSAMGRTDVRSSRLTAARPGYDHHAG
jgi:hypothetical protein